MGEIRISVIMSVYNEKVEWVREAINSILSQTFKEFEYIIILDNPTRSDLIEEIIKYKKNNNCISFIQNNANYGAAISRNIGIKKAKGEYVAIMDADDVSNPNRLQVQYEYMQRNKQVGISGAKIRFFGEGIDKKVWNVPTAYEEIKVALLFECVIANPTVIMRKSYLDSFNLKYKEDNYFGEDYYLWQQAINNFEITNLEEILLNYRIRSDSLTNFLDIEKKKEIHKEIYILGLKDLEIDNIERNINFHMFLCGWKIDEKINSEFWHDFKKYIFKIIDTNRKLKIYEPSILEKVIYEKWLIILQNNIKEFEAKCNMLNEELIKHMNSKELIISVIMKEIYNQNKVIIEITKMVDERDKVINSMDKLVTEKDTTITSMTKMIDERDEVIKHTEQLVRERDTAMSSMTKMIEERDDYINLLEGATKCN